MSLPFTANKSTNVVLIFQVLQAQNNHLAQYIIDVIFLYRRAGRFNIKQL